MIDLKRLTRDELVGRLAGIGQPAWQADEVRRFLFAKGVQTIAALTAPSSCCCAFTTAPRAKRS